MFELVKIFANPVMLLSIIKGGLLFLFISIVLLATCRVLKLFRRKNRIIDKLTYIYYLYIPVVLVGFGISFFAVGSVKDQAVKVVEHTRPALSSYTSEYMVKLYSYIAGYSVQNYEDLSLDALKDVAVVYVMENSFLAGQQDIFDKVPNVAKIWLSKIIVEVVSAQLTEKFANVTKLDKSVVKSLWSSDLRILMDGGLVPNLLIAQIESRAKSFQTTLVLIMFALMCVPVFETGISKLLEAKRKEPSLETE